MADKSKITFGLFAEEYSPVFFAVITAIVLHWNFAPIQSAFAEYGWSLSNLYSAIFSWSAIQTGFLFSVYGFVAGKGDGFIGAMGKTLALRNFIRYTKRAIFAGFILTLISIPLIVANTNFDTQNKYVALLIIGWFSLFVWAFISFLRVAYIFGLMSQIKDQERIKG